MTLKNLNFIKAISNTLNLTKTDIEIIKILISDRSGLLVSDLIKKIRRSERNVRNRLDELIQKGIIKREIEILKNKRLAYKYYIESNDNIVNRLKRYLFDEIQELNKLNCEY